MNEVVVSNGPAIEINNLEMVYSDLFGNNKVRALDGISLSVKRGEIFGFLGPNGAGKTTTIHNIMNFIFPTAGDIKVFGLPATNAKCRRKVGFLPELFSFDGYLRGKKLLRYLGMLSGVSGAETEKRGRELLRFFGMEDAIDRKIRTYSKGMTQKIGLAQAMLSDPDLLILDEPTSGMDPIAKKKVREKFLELKNQGKTVFLSSHILSDVQLIADRVAIINKGKLIKVDTVENLLKKSDDTEIIFSLDDSRIETIKSNWNIKHLGETTWLNLAPDKGQKAVLIAKLSELGADIISITSSRTDLEDIFMQLVENGD
jgi:ABC-2 type transport system ATP-binding protein